MWRLEVTEVEGGGEQVQLTELTLVGSDGSLPLGAPTILPAIAGANASAMSNGNGGDATGTEDLNCNPLPCSFTYNYTTATTPAKLRWAYHDDVTRTPLTIHVKYSNDGSIWNDYSTLHMPAPEPTSDPFAMKDMTLLAPTVPVSSTSATTDPEEKVWCIVVRDVQGGGDVVQLSEMTFLASDGTRLLPDAVPDVSPGITEGSQDAGIMNNGISVGEHQSCSPLPCRYTYSFNTASTPSQVRWAIHDHPDSAPKTLDVKYSNNGTAWNEFATLVIGPEMVPEANSYREVVMPLAYSVGGASEGGMSVAPEFTTDARKWRITVNQVRGMGPVMQLTELTLLGSDGQRIEGTPVVSPAVTNAGSSAAMLNDGIQEPEDGSSGTAECNPLPCTFTYLYAAPVTPSELRWGYSNLIEKVPVQFILERSADGGTLWSPYAVLDVAEDIIPLANSYLDVDMMLRKDSQNWRIAVESVQGGGNQVNVVEMSLLGADGSPLSRDAPSVTPGITAGNTDPAVMNDGDGTVTSETGDDQACDALPCYYAYTYATAVTPTKIRWAYNDNADKAPMVMMLQYSDQAGIWVDYSKASVPFAELPVAASYTYDERMVGFNTGMSDRVEQVIHGIHALEWRIEVVSVQGGGDQVQVSEMTFVDDLFKRMSDTPPTVSPEITGGADAVGLNNSPDGPTHTVDDDTDNVNCDPLPCFFTYSFSEKVSPSKVRWGWHGVDAEYERAPKEMRVQYSDDGTTWSEHSKFDFSYSRVETSLSANHYLDTDLNKKTSLGDPSELSTWPTAFTNFLSRTIHIEDEPATSSGSITGLHMLFASEPCDFELFVLSKVGAVFTVEATTPVTLPTPFSASTVLTWNITHGSLPIKVGEYVGWFFPCAASNVGRSGESGTHSAYKGTYPTDGTCTIMVGSTFDIEAANTPTACSAVTSAHVTGGVGTMYNQAFQVEYTLD
jgi:hypothetical protein